MQLRLELCWSLGCSYDLEHDRIRAANSPEATHQRAELESLVKRLKSEKQSWEKVAKEKEAMVVSLSKTLERLRESAWAEDAESSNGHDDDDDDQVLFFLDQGNERGGAIAVRSEKDGVQKLPLIKSQPGGRDKGIMETHYGSIKAGQASPCTVKPVQYISRNLKPVQYYFTNLPKTCTVYFQFTHCSELIGLLESTLICN
nr:probable BOI-related E3 ubiquitin-protein ligase 3 [Ipomoea batatas]